MRLFLITAASTLALTACTTVPAGSEPVREFADTCKADGGQRFVGQRASSETAAAIMGATHSKRLRWVPPRTAVTADYAFGRVTVSYDDNYAITTVSCS